MVYVAKYFLKHVTTALGKACVEAGQEPYMVTLYTPEEGHSKLSVPSRPDSEDEAQGAAPKPSRKPAVYRQLTDYFQPIHPWNTFNNFVVARSNQMAYECCQEIALGDNLNNDFLLLVSDSGLGKTHLLHSVATAAASLKKRVGCLTAQDYSRHFVDSLNEKNYRVFAEAYKDFDILLLECITFFASRPKFENEICETLDFLQNKGAKVIMTSTQPLKNIPGLTNHCRSRLSSAVISQIGIPDYETRMTILTRLNKAMGYKIPTDVLEYVAQNCPPDGRTLSSTLKSLFAFGRAEKKPVDTTMAKEFLDYTTNQETNEEKLGNLKRVLMDVYNLTETELLSKSKKKSITEARSIGIYLARHLFNNTYPEIDKAFNKKHPTSLYNYNKVLTLIQEDETFRKHVEFLCHQIGYDIHQNPVNPKK
jgi:chromosomal replication initiator protein